MAARGARHKGERAVLRITPSRELFPTAPRESCCPSPWGRCFSRGGQCRCRLAAVGRFDGGRLMYVAVKGGEAAIAAAHDLLARDRRGDPAVPELTTDQIREQLTLAVNRVMCEGSLYDPDLAALAVKQARGDLIEAIFLLRAYRTTLPRLGFAEPVNTNAMAIRRRISATYKDLPGGQVLGPTFDYTHRLLDPDLAGSSAPVTAARADAAEQAPAPHVTQLLDREGLIEANAETD